MLTRVEIKKHQTDQSFSLKVSLLFSIVSILYGNIEISVSQGHTMHPKYLKIIIADNWGGPQTLIERIKVR